MNKIVDDLMGLAETSGRRTRSRASLRRLRSSASPNSCVRLSNSATDPSFLTLYRKDESGITLEVRSIDPSASLTEVCGSHACCILIQARFTVESFKNYYFGKAKVTTLALPNAFPKENRVVACANDITTAYSMRQNKDNTNKIVEYIRAFSALKGNRACYFPSYQIPSPMQTSRSRHPWKENLHRAPGCGQCQRRTHRVSLPANTERVWGNVCSLRREMERRARLPG